MYVLDKSNLDKNLGESEPEARLNIKSLKRLKYLSLCRHTSLPPSVSRATLLQRSEVHPLCTVPPVSSQQSLSPIMSHLILQLLQHHTLPHCH